MQQLPQCLHLQPTEYEPQPLSVSDVLDRAPAKSMHYDSSAIFQTSCLLACVDTVDALQIFMTFDINNELTGKKQHEKVKLHEILRLDQGYGLLRTRCDGALKWLGMTGR